jgi:hypothetical protein
MRWWNRRAFGPPFLALALVAGHAVSRLASTVLIFVMDYVTRRRQQPSPGRWRSA